MGGRLLKIGFFVPWITQGRGGTENVGQMMANAMARRGHEVHIFTFDDKNRPSTWPLEEGISLHRLPEGEGSHVVQQAVFAVADVSLDLLVGLHMNRTFGVYVKVAHKLQLPLVLSEHIDPRFPERLGRFPRAEREVVFSGADGIHLLVEDFRDTLPDFLHERVQVIPNTVPPAKKMACPAGDFGSRKILLGVARLMPRKNMNILLEAFSTLATEFDDWDLVIVGDGPERASLEASAEACGMADRVILAGHSDSIYQYYEEAQLFAIPSYFEGQPLTVLEAMAHGLPCLGFEFCHGVAAEVVHDQTGFLARGSFEHGSFVRDLRLLMSDATLRKRFGEAGLRRYEEQFGEELIEQRWEALFRKVVHEYTPKASPSRSEQAAVDLSRYLAH